MAIQRPYLIAEARFPAVENLPMPSASGIGDRELSHIRARYRLLEDQYDDQVQLLQDLDREVHELRQTSSKLRTENDYLRGENQALKADLVQEKVHNHKRPTLLVWKGQRDTASASASTTDAVA